MENASSKKGEEQFPDSCNLVSMKSRPRCSQINQGENTDMLNQNQAMEIVLKSIPVEISDAMKNSLLSLD